MGHARTLTLASVSTAGGLAISKYRTIVRELESQPIVSPDLTGRVVTTPAPWGTCAYRIVEGDQRADPLVLIHGWGKTADSTWWPILKRSVCTVISVDLPGHGRSILDSRFELSHAVSAANLALQDAGYDRGTLVGHSLGGAVALMADYESPARFARLVIIASAAYWFRPRLWVTLAAEPYVMASRSPFLLRSRRRELRSGAEAARHTSWSYQCRPPGSLNRQTASALRRFDAREWSLDTMPQITWVITSLDGVIDPTCQRESADLFEAEVVDVEGGHSVVGERPDTIARIIDR